MPGSSQDFLDMFTGMGGKGMDAEQKRLSDMRGMNGMQFDTGERSQGDQEAEQRMTQNEKTAILQKVANFLNKINPFDRLFPDNRVEDPVSGQKVNPDFLKLLQNRPDLRERFDRTGSIYSDM